MQTTLFDHHQTTAPVNLLPKGGQVHYFPSFLGQDDCINLVNVLVTSLQWQPDQLVMFGRSVTTQRKVAWVGDPECAYTYSGVRKVPQPWTPELVQIKNKVEEISASDFNSCLLNYYANGSEGMGYHSDDEKELDRQSPIASLSLGGVRKFAFRHKSEKLTRSLFLENGSLLVMHAPTQQCWQHSLLKTKTAVPARINLTFRKIVQTR